MSYIVIERMAARSTPSLQPTPKAITLFFETAEEAQKKVEDCQDGLVVEI